MNSVGTDVFYSLHRGLGPGGAEEDAECMDGKITDDMRGGKIIENDSDREDKWGNEFQHQQMQNNECWQKQSLL